MRKFSGLFLLTAAIALIFFVAIFFRYSDFSIQNDGFILPVIAVAALVDSVNPCAFSVLILTIGFLLSLQKTRGRILKIGGIYIFGIFLIYILIGLGILRALQFFDTPNFIAKAGAGVLILYGVISLLSKFPFFPIKLKIPDFTHSRIASFVEAASLPAGFALGIFVGLFEFPCTGGPYLSILGLLRASATFSKGFAYLIFYNLIFVLPLVLILLLGSDKNLLQAVRDWQKKDRKHMKFAGDIVLILLGAFLIYLG